MNEIKSVLELNDILSREKTIIIYGAGFVAEGLLNYINVFHKKIKICVVVTDLKENDRYICGNDIHEKNYIIGKKGKIILAVTKRFCQEILKEISEMRGENDIYVFSDHIVKLFTLINNSVINCVKSVISNEGENLGTIIPLSTNSHCKYDDLVFKCKIGDWSGFFSLWRRSIEAVDFAKTRGMIPYIEWTKETMFYDGNIGGNAFEYYFEQPSIVNQTTINQYKNVVLGTDNLTVTRKLGYFIPSREVLEWFSKIYKEFFALKKEIKVMIENSVNSMMLSNNTIGVHIRGVEWRNHDVIDHPIPPEIDRYFELMYEAVNEYKFNDIFLATDSEEVIRLAINEFGEKIKFYKNVLRSPIDSHELIFEGFDETGKTYKKHIDGFRIGYEILQEAYTLASCGGFISGSSNVSNAVRCIKIANGEEFSFDKIIFSGVNTKSSDKTCRIYDLNLEV